MSLGVARAFAAAIRELRDTRTQDECASAAGIATRSWSRWESGRILPEAASLDRAALGLGIDAQTLEVAMGRHLLKPPAERRSPIDRATDDTLFVLDPLVRDELYTMADRLWEISGGDRDSLPAPRRRRARRLFRTSLLYLVGAFQLLDPAADGPAL